MIFKALHTNLVIIIWLCVVGIGQAQSTLTTPPKLTAEGNQAYCPLSQIPIVTEFNIENPDAVEITTFYVQITPAGYERGKDILKLTGTHPNISAKPFNSSEGKLELNWIGAGTPTDSEFISAIKDVIFETNTSLSFGERGFSITFGEANYLPSTDHYYEYISSAGITWTQAKSTAEARNYYGLKGYLATITSEEEAQICGKQAAGQGWIGGSDDETEGVWKWVTGPEAGSTFWFGLSNGNSIGADYTYTNWDTNEPNDWPDGSNIPGQENFAHVYNNGRWNDYPNFNNNIQGYIVEYGSPDEPSLDVSASTKIYIPVVDSTSSPEPICGSGNVTLSANSTTGTILWFDANIEGDLLETGNNYTTPPISETTTYYVSSSPDGICETGLRTPILVTVYDIPQIISAPDETICGAGTGTLTATASAGEINWYANSSGGISLETGNSYSPTISTTTTYYVDATENDCTTSARTPVTLFVEYVNEPTATTPQSFCDVDDASLQDIIITGNSVLWYENLTGGFPLSTSTLLINNTTYYASQTINGCESTRIPVLSNIYKTVDPLRPSEIPILEECDDSIDGDDTNGFSNFNLTLNEDFLINGGNPDDFSFLYYTDSNYSPNSKISNPTNFRNTIVNGQPIYVRIENKYYNSCFTESSFNIKVNPLPIIQSPVTLKNCDEDGVPDGYTDFNLTEADPFITNGDTNLIVTYYLTFNEADTSTNPVNPSPFNSKDAIDNKVYARVENSFECHRVATVKLEVSTTYFPENYMFNLESCDNDNSIDGTVSFDLTQASQDIVEQFPTGQNLSVHYYRNLTDAQLSENEILPQTNYVNETPFLQILSVRVQSEDNGDCFGIGPHLTLTVFPRPEFIIVPEAIVCLNLPPITIEPIYAKGDYTYEWFNENGSLISSEPEVKISEKGIYTSIATSTYGCESFPQTVTVTESIIATIDYEDVTITDDSNNNTIYINNENNNLGIGEYEFALDDHFGPYQDESYFEMVEAGIHTIFVRDKNQCGIADLDVSVLGFPKFFTPNNDGHNDYWNVNGVTSDFYETSLVYIFDRYGKLITQIPLNVIGWDGSYNGVQLPATDYWFTAQLVDIHGNIRERKGHFSLIR